MLRCRSELIGEMENNKSATTTCRKVVQHPTGQCGKRAAPSKNTEIKQNQQVYEANAENHDHQHTKATSPLSRGEQHSSNLRVPVEVIFRAARLRATTKEEVIAMMMFVSTGDNEARWLTPLG